MEWEYLFIAYYNKLKPEIIINGERLETFSGYGYEEEKISLYDLMNDLGEEGWELVVTETSRITNEINLIFKRQYWHSDNQYHPSSSRSYTCC